MGMNSAFGMSLGEEDRFDGFNNGDILSAVSIVQSLNGLLLDSPSSSELLVEVSESHLSPNLNILPAHLGWRRHS